MPDDLKTLEKKLEAQIKEMEAIQKAREDIEKRAKPIEKIAKELENPMLALDGFAAALLKAVKDSDGLIDGAPAALKALQKAEKQATVETVESAIDQLVKQQALAKKEGQAGPKQKAAAAEFCGDLDILIKKLNALL